jgi:two-component system phosphate regulon sensor histidine kinase PhoR
MSILQRTSFTTRLLALALAVMMLLVIVDYVALLEVPERISRDTVELALRENAQALNAIFKDDRDELKEAVNRFVDDPDVRRMILRGDEDALAASAGELGPDVLFQVRDGESDDPFEGVGPISYPYHVQGSQGSADIVFYRPVDDELLDRATATSGDQAPFALEKDGAFTARSSNFPRSIDPLEAGSTLDPSVAKLQDIEVDGSSLHLYSRMLSSTPEYQLHALSTPELEQNALAEIRGDVRMVIGGMTLATIAAFMLMVMFTNRTVRGFGTRVRMLADGDYGTRMVVRGNDAFADLAGSVNRLSEQIDVQVGQLEDTAQAFGRTLETLEEGICVWDEHGTITFWNRGAEQLTGLARERANTDDSLIVFLAAERAPGTRRVTLPIRRGGLVVDLVVTGMPGGGVVQTFRDTTMVDLMQQTQRNFMATAAHELRTPITTILGFSDTLVNPELELSDRQRDEFVSIIRDHAYQLQEIADAFFTNHQLANERVEVSIAPARVDGIVADSIERVRIQLPDRAEQIDGIDVNVPADAVVLADRRAFVGVVAVLVENAIKYGGAPITVDVERSGGTMTLLVRDQGPGIEQHHHARLFDPFYRVDVDMRSGVGGAGLGLFTARKLVEAMHGALRVLSAPGAGATFVVELPIAPDRRADGDGDDHGDTSLRLVAG